MKRKRKVYSGAFKARVAMEAMPSAMLDSSRNAQVAWCATPIFHFVRRATSFERRSLRPPQDGRRQETTRC